jgi:transcriptional regulator with XRE-family HTH domain
MANMMKLRGAMAGKGITQEKLAEIIGIDRTTLIRKMKNDGLQFTVEEVQKIAVALSLTAQEVLDIFFTTKVA